MAVYGDTKCVAKKPIQANNVRPLAYMKKQACEALGDMSHDSFEKYVLPEVRVIRRGRLRLIPVSELENWVARNASRTLEVEAR